MKPRKLDRRPHGFSLVEILVVLAIIGIILGLSIPALIRIREGALESATRANAHNLASTATNAVTAGSPALLAATGKEQAIALLRDGVYGGGDFATTRFRVTLGDAEAADAAERLRFSGGLLIYEEP